MLFRTLTAQFNHGLPTYIAAGWGLAIIKLHICLRSELQFSIGPNEVFAQSIDLAKRICAGIESVIGNRVQSKEGESAGTTGMRLLALSTELAREVSEAGFAKGLTYVEALGRRAVASERSVCCGTRTSLRFVSGVRRD